MLNIDKFNWQELFNNNNGKTSASSFAGVITVLISVITFAFGCFTKNEVIINNSVIMAGIGSALLGVNKWRDSVLPQQNIDQDQNG